MPQRYRDHFTGPEVLAALRQHGPLHFREICSILEVHGFTAQGELIQVLRLLYRQGLILSDTPDFDGWECDATVELSPSIPGLAQALGISIQELAERDPRHSVIVTPLFGRATYTAADVADVFVLMPFREDLRSIYEDHIKAVAARLCLSIKRADDIFSAREVMQDVWSGICGAKALIADCTGRNPNVFYEIGMAHTLGKPVILITQSGDDVPSDLRGIRYIQYQYTPPGMRTFERVLQETLNATISTGSHDIGFC
jgi:hypothetical protein